MNWLIRFVVAVVVTSAVVAVPVLLSRPVTQPHVVLAAVAVAASFMLRTPKWLALAAAALLCVSAALALLNV